MKNFFKFEPIKSTNEFNVQEPELPLAKKHNKDENINTSLEKNIDALKDFFHYPLSNDFKIRTIDININNQTYNAAIFFYDGLVDSNELNKSVLKPLMKSICFESKSVLKKLQSNVL